MLNRLLICLEKRLCTLTITARRPRHSLAALRCQMALHILRPDLFPNASHKSLPISGSYCCQINDYQRLMLIDALSTHLRINIIQLNSVYPALWTSAPHSPSSETITRNCRLKYADRNSAM